MIGTVTEATEALDALAPEIAARAAEGEAARRLPADLAAKLAAAGAFRLITPRALGGLEATPREIVEVLARIAAADASAGWCAMIAATTALNAAYLPEPEAREVFGDPGVIAGGVFAPMGRATPEGEGFRVSGRWAWGSGSANCDWLCCGCLVMEGEGPRRLPSGAPDIRMMIFPAAEAELIDTWHVMGLKGTGSGDIAAREVFVPAARSVSLFTDRPRQAGALYRFPPFGLLSLGVAAVALGNAAAAVRAFTTFAAEKRPASRRKPMAEIPAIQSGLAEAAALERAARAYLLAEADRVWALAEGAAGPAPLADRADLRMACTHATRTSAEVCRSLYDLAGGDALYEHAELQRRFRDAHAMTQHIVTSGATWEVMGRVLLGVDVPADQI